MDRDITHATIEEIIKLHQRIDKLIEDNNLKVKDDEAKDE